MIKTSTQQIAFIALVSFVASMSTFLMLYALLASPVADDWTYYNYFTNGFSDYMVASMNHTGRVLQWVLVFVAYKLFGLAIGVKVIPVFLYIVFVASFFWFLRLIKLFRVGWQIDLVLATLVVNLYLFLVPSVYDTYLWLTSSSVYLSSLAMLFITLCLVILMLRSAVPWWAKILFFVFIALGQTFSEPTALFIIGLGVLSVIISVVRKKKEHYKVLITSLASAIIGFAIVYFSPGSISRRRDGGSFDWTYTFIDSLGGYKLLFWDWKLWVILGLVLFLTVVVFANTKKQRTDQLSKFYLLLSLGSLLLSTYPVFVLNNYTQNYMPLRVLSLPTLGVVVSVVFLSLYVSSRWHDVLSDKKFFLDASLLTAILIASPFVLYRASTSISSLSTRDSISTYRDISVAEQVQASKEVINIPKAPVTMRSDASDFFYGDGQWDRYGRNWVLNSYLEYKGIDIHGTSSFEVKLFDLCGQELGGLPLAN